MRYEPADIFFVAGEASGDLQASLGATAARGLRPALRTGAIGGARLRASGAAIAYDSSELASIGPISVLPRIPLLYYILRRLERSLRRRPSRLVVPVDAGAFNLRLIALLRHAGYGGTIVYYFPPGAWLDSPAQARAVAAGALALTPFRHQRDFYARLGLRSEWFGHPLASVIASRGAHAPASGARPLVAVLPGSRREEVMRHLPTLARAARELDAAGAASFVLVAASDSRAAQIRRSWERLGGPSGAAVSCEEATDVLGRSDLAWIASGTATLEAALTGVPQIVFYEVSAAQYRVAQRRLPKELLHHIGLPNLVVGREIVPEFVQAEFTAGHLVRETSRLLGDDAARADMLADYAQLRHELGPPDALARIAAFVLERMEDGRAS